MLKVPDFTLQAAEAVFLHDVCEDFLTRTFFFVEGAKVSSFGAFFGAIAIAPQINGDARGVRAVGFGGV